MYISPYSYTEMYDRDASLECLLEYMQAVYELLGSADPPQTVALTFRAWLEQVAPLVDYCGNGVRRRATEASRRLPPHHVLVSMVILQNLTTKGGIAGEYWA